MAVMLRSEFADEFFSRLPYLKAIFMEEFGEPDAGFEGIWNILSSDRMREQFTHITGFSLPVARPENEPITYDKLYQAYNKTFTQSEFGLGYQVSKRARRDDLDGIFATATQALARSMRTGKATTVWNVFNNGDTTAESVGDGVALFSTAHPLREGGTYSNRQTADPSITSIEAAVNSFDGMLDHRGLPIEISPRWVLFRPTLRWVFRELLGSPDKPDTASRSINPISDVLEPRENRYLTGTTDWFVGSEASQNRLMLINNQEVQDDQDLDFDTDAAKFKATMIFIQGAADWRGLYASYGT